MELCHFAATDWIGLIGIAVGVVAVFYKTIAGVRRDVRDDMITLDREWQVRTKELADSIHTELAELRHDIPPSWFLERVKNLESGREKHEERIDAIERGLGK